MYTRTEKAIRRGRIFLNDFLDNQTVRSKREREREREKRRSKQVDCD